MIMAKVNIPRIKVTRLLKPVRKDKIKKITVNKFEQVFFNVFLLSVILEFDIFYLLPSLKYKIPKHLGPQ